MNKQERQAYISKMNTERDLRNQLDYARSEGLAKGMAQGMTKGMEKGRKEALTESARKFKAQNVPIEVISSCTGLSVEEIMAL